MTKRYVPMLIVIILLLAFGLVNGESYRDAFQFLSPIPGAKLVTKETSIIIRTGDIIASNEPGYYSRVIIAGSVSGNHGFDVILAEDDKTIILKPNIEFTPGEIVTVDFSDGLSFSFEISNKTYPLLNLKDWQDIYYGESWDADYQNSLPVQGDLTTDRDVSLPSDFPSVEVYINNNPSPGYIFLSNIPMPYPVYLQIIDNSGDPVYYKKMPQWSFDFKKQPNGLLTYNSFPQPQPGVVHATYYAMNNVYAVVDSFKCGNGYYAFAADMQLSLDYHALLMSYDPQTVDMSEIVPGGNPAATVIGLIVQELDSLKNVVFQWRSWDHYEITDAMYDVDLTGAHIDYVHGDAVEWDDDGNILLCCRHMDEVTKIDRATGDIIWRLGGENNDFTLVGDTVWFSHQHDIRRLDNGNITLQDNGNLHTPQFSRAVEYTLDEIAMTCTHVWEYRDNPDIYGSANGNVQRLADGNTFWCRGNTWPNMVEVQLDGTKELELSFPPLQPIRRTFKAYKFLWTGIASAPYLLAENSEFGYHLIYNKFGDGSIVAYNIYLDTIPNPITLIGNTAETYYDATELLSGKTYFCRVTALDYIYIESDYSNEEALVWWMPYSSGDANGDGNVISSDVTYAVNYFRGGPQPPDSVWYETGQRWHYAAADANGDCSLIGSDVTYLVNYFRGAGNPPLYCPDTPPYGAGE